MFEQAFKNIDDVLWKEAGCTTELDYTEQTSWLLFLKYLDGLEQDKADEAALEGKKYAFILDKQTPARHLMLHRYSHFRCCFQGARRECHFHEGASVGRTDARNATCTSMIGLFTTMQLPFQIPRPPLEPGVVKICAAGVKATSRR